MHKPTGTTLDQASSLQADWTIETPGGAVKLSQCTVSARADDKEVRYTIDTGKGVSFEMVFTVSKDEVRSGIENIQGDLRKVLFNNDPLLVVSADTGAWQLAATLGHDGRRPAGERPGGRPAQPPGAGAAGAAD